MEHSFKNASISARSAGTVHQARPQPAESSLGTGIIRPDLPVSLHAFSKAMASEVVWNVEKFARSQGKTVTVTETGDGFELIIQ